MPGLHKVVVYDREGLHDYHDDMVMFVEELYDLGRVHEKKHPGMFEGRGRQIETGRHRHSCLHLRHYGGAQGSDDFAPEHPVFAGFDDDDAAGLRNRRAGLFLPLCHILERFISVFSPIAFKSTVNFAESPETVFDNVQEVSPHVFTAVPRVWEKVYSRISIMVGDATPFGRWAYNQALASGMKVAADLEEGRPVTALARLRFRFWDFVVLKNIRRIDRRRSAAPGHHGGGSDLAGLVAMVQGDRHRRIRRLRHE